jgi:hypothetical protein
VPSYRSPCLYGCSFGSIASSFESSTGLPAEAALRRRTNTTETAATTDNTPRKTSPTGPPKSVRACLVSLCPNNPPTLPRAPESGADSPRRLAFLRPSLSHTVLRLLLLPRALHHTYQTAPGYKLLRSTTGGKEVSLLLTTMASRDTRRFHYPYSPTFREEVFSETELSVYGLSGSPLLACV